MHYKNEKTQNISFPLGGIGTGCIGLRGNGELIDFEIFNRPNKNTRNGYSHFAIKAVQGEKSTLRVLHGDTPDNLIGPACAAKGHFGFGHGPRESSMAGFPHFRNVQFEAKFPFATLTFSDEDFPAVIRLTAFNPMIPHDDKNSSLPVALFTWEIENITDQSIEYALAFTSENPARDCCHRSISEDGFTGVFMGRGETSEEDPAYADLTILADAEDSVAQEYWYRGRWKDGCTTYWKNMLNCSRLPARHYDEVGRMDHGTVASYLTLGPGEKGKARFVFAWNAPNASNYWDPAEGDKPWKNYYATLFQNSLETAKYAFSRFDMLYQKTDAFASALRDSTLPLAVYDAVSANLSVLKSPTVLRLTDGSLWAWEGVSEKAGSCHGSCQHVWNYAYALPFLFPALERSLRENTYKYALHPSGQTDFRIPLPLDRCLKNPWRACVDGQMGEVIKSYREWKISGDDGWLREHGEEIFRMLEYAWSPENPDRWDANMDGVMEGRQHHTLDMELFGPSSWLQSLYLLALDCAAKMAEALGETERATRYRSLYEKGREWTNEHLFNGEYFQQKVDLFDKSVVDAFGAEEYWNAEAGEIKYQIAGGSEIDQMLGEFHAHLIGAEGVFDADKKQIALENIFRYNFKSSLREVTNMWRDFALNDEAGTVICAYPEDKRVPAIPVPYCEECWPGCEYALASLMAAEGLVQESNMVVKAVRDRFDGENRNPWNEFECGSNYARSMSSFALLPVYAGFRYDMTKQYIGFDPIQSGNGRYMFSIKNSYGMVEFADKARTITILGEPLSLSTLSFREQDKVRRVLIDGQEISFVQTGKMLTFPMQTVNTCVQIELK